MSLFDHYTRTDMSGRRHSEPEFDFLNRSAWRSVEIARQTLESWFSRVPHDNRTDVRGRFRGDDRSHASALLQIVTHEVLSALCTSVDVGPDLYGGNPDFAAHYKGLRLVAECTVAQGTDSEFNSSQRESTLKDLVDLIDSSAFSLEWESISVGASQPSARSLRRNLHGWLRSLDPVAEAARIGQGVGLPSFAWEEGDWKVHFTAVYVGEDLGNSIGIVSEPAHWLTEDLALKSSLERKAGRYRPNVPYLIVVSQRDGIYGNEVIADALFGRNRVLVSSSGVVGGGRRFDGFWGAPSRPRNRHVSAVLFKRSIRNAWDVCVNVHVNGRQGPSWHLFHNPAAAVPLQRGIFPFAAEYPFGGSIDKGEKPNRNLNDLLGLPIPWPGEEH